MSLICFNFQIILFNNRLKINIDLILWIFPTFLNLTRDELFLFKVKEQNKIEKISKLELNFIVSSKCLQIYRNFFYFKKAN